jgi:hypothetical protein
MVAAGASVLPRLKPPDAIFAGYEDAPGPLIGNRAVIRTASEAASISGLFKPAISDVADVSLLQMGRSSEAAS